jgi:hypothetical protein
MSYQYYGDRTPEQDDNLRHFIAELRDGRRLQGQGSLNMLARTKPEDSRRTRRFCCLGVACEVAIKDGLELARKVRIDKNWSNVTATGEVIALGEAEQVGYGDADGTSFLPKDAVDWYGLASDPSLYLPEKYKKYWPGWALMDNNRAAPIRTATYLNDSSKATFKEIADCFEYTFLREDYYTRYPDERPTE